MTRELTLLAMKGLEISGENLEDLLAYDDLFLDYFNAFLVLPVFPQALVYNRLTGAFEEQCNEAQDSDVSFAANPVSLRYGPRDAERERMLEWARHERLPVFLRSHLFHELKLVKLLLRPLEDRQSTSRGSGQSIRGYSRQTETYISSLSNSVDNSGNDALDDDDDDDDDDLWGDLNYSALFPYQRPGSWALSMPIVSDNLPPFEWVDVASISNSSSSIHPRTSSTKQQTVRSTDKRRGSTKRRCRKVEIIPGEDTVKNKQRMNKPPASSTEEAFIKGVRALSAPVSYEQYLKLPHLVDFDAMFGEEEPEPREEVYVTFEDDYISDQQTVTDMRKMEGRLKMTMQQMKEQVLSTRTGFESFREFLKETSSYHLLEFWLDCEDFKDTVELNEDNEKDIRKRLFRDIQDRYKLKLTQDAKEQISHNANNMTLSHTIFLRTQYDVLRRLRAYWLLRYLIHCEHTNAFSSEILDSVPDLEFKFLKTRAHALLFPTISLARSLPVLPEEAKTFTFTSIPKQESHAGLKRVTSSVSRKSIQQSRHSQSKNGTTPETLRPIKQRFLLAMSQDKAAGGPFKRYLSQHGEEKLLSCLLFWQDVLEYKATEDRSRDRLLRLRQAWSLYNKYISQDSPHSLDLSEKEGNYLHKKLQSTGDLIQASIFDKTKIQAVNKLEQAWIRYLKEDLKKFLDCCVRIDGESPPSTAEAIEITVTHQDVLIHRPRPWVKRLQPLRDPGSGATERAERLQKALDMAEDIDAERKDQKKREAIERRKEMEKMRRKAIRAAYARQREAKKMKQGMSAKSDWTEENDDRKTATYQDFSNNKQVMSMFHKYLSENNEKEAQKLIHLQQEIENLLTFKEDKQKEVLTTQITKTYLDTSQFVATNFKQTLNADKEPQELQAVQDLILPKLEEVFQDFLAQQEGLEVKPNHPSSIVSQPGIAAVTSGNLTFPAGTKSKAQGGSKVNHTN